MPINFNVPVTLSKEQQRNRMCVCCQALSMTAIAVSDAQMETRQPDIRHQQGFPSLQISKIRTKSSLFFSVKVEQITYITSVLAGLSIKNTVICPEKCILQDNFLKIPKRMFEVRMIVKRALQILQVTHGNPGICFDNRLFLWYFHDRFLFPVYF